MKTIILFLFITILAVNVACAQSDWVTYKIDSRLSVKMPTEPQRQDENSVSSVGRDSSVYFVSITYLDSDTIKFPQLLSKPEFVNGLKSGMQKKMPGFTLGDIKKNTWKGYLCYQVEGENDFAHLKLNCSMIIIGPNLYLLGSVLRERKSTNKNDDFFNSLTLN